MTNRRRGRFFLLFRILFLALVFVMPFCAAAEDEAALEERVKQAVSEAVRPGMGDWEKALALHDWLALSAEYGSVGDHSCYEASGVLLYGLGVCESYSEAYKLLLKEVGIVSYIRTDNYMQHGWNWVCLDGDWYNIDVTWDDMTGSNVSHMYFCVSDYALRDVPSHGMMLKDPGTAYRLNYAYRTGELDSFLENAREWIREELDAGSTDFSGAVWMRSGDQYGIYRSTAALVLRDELFPVNGKPVRLSIDFSPENSMMTVSVPPQERLPGDADGNGTVGMRDALSVLRYVRGEEEEINTENADVNRDGRADMKDALLILQADCGWNVSLQ